MEISKDMVQYVATLSKISLDEVSTEKMEKELNSVVEYMDILNQLDTTDVEPRSHVFDVKNVLRKDDVGKSYDREELLVNAPARTEEAFMVPKTVD